MTEHAQNSEYEQLLIEKRNLNRKLAEIDTKILQVKPESFPSDFSFDIALAESIKFENQYTFSYDLKNMRYLFVDENVEKMTGYSREEYQQFDVNAFFDKVHPDDVQSLKDGYKVNIAHAENHSHRFFDLKFRFRLCDGTYIPVHEWGVILFDENGNPDRLHAVMHDLSDYMRVADNCELIIQLVNKSPEFAFLYDQSGRIIHANETALKKLGYKIKDLESLNVWDIEASVPYHLWSMLWDSIVEKGSVRFETEFRTKSQQKIPVENYIHYIEKNGKQYAFVIARDITINQKTRKALLASREQYKLIVDNQKELVVKLDSKLNCVYASPSVSETLGIPEMKILGKPLTLKTHPEDNAKFLRAQFEKVYIGDFEAYQEYRIKTPEGWRWFAWSHKALLDEKNHVKEIISVGRDINDKKLAELELNINRKRYEIAVEAGHMVVWEHDLLAGKVFIDQGDHGKTIGKNQDVIDQDEWIDKVYEEDRELVNIAFRQLVSKEKKSVYCEIRVYDLNGEISWRIIRAVAIENKSGEVIKIVGTSSCIDKLKAVEKELSDRLRNEALIAGTSKFLVTDFTFESIYSVVKLLQETSKAKRVILFENVNTPTGLAFKPFVLNGKTVASSTWSKSQKAYKYVPDYFELMKIMSRTDPAELVNDEFETFELLKDNKCDLGYFIPLFVSGQFWGFIAFFFVEGSVRKDSSNGLMTCKIIAEMISSFLFRKQSQDALTKAHHTLEQRIELRTKDLTVANEKLKQQAIEQARIAKQLEESQSKLKHLNQKLLESSEDARRKISAELHDSVAQDLVVLQLVLKNILNKCCKEDSCLEQPTEICTNIIHEIRSICQGLYPPALETLGLNKALINLTHFYQRTGMIVHLNWSYKTQSVRFKPSFEIAIFRIVQEAMSNAMRHGKANEINVNIRNDAQNMLVEIINDGDAFDSATLSSQGLGMQTMNNRADAIGGKLDIENVSAGTKVTVIIPEENIEILNYPKTDI